MTPTAEQIWERVQELMPKHNCGERMRPGATPSNMHVLVCAPCSTVTAVTPDWVADKVREATNGLMSEAEQ